MFISSGSLIVFECLIKQFFLIGKGKWNVLYLHHQSHIAHFPTQTQWHYYISPLPPFGMIGGGGGSYLSRQTVTNFRVNIRLVLVVKCTWLRLGWRKACIIPTSSTSQTSHSSTQTLWYHDAIKLLIKLFDLLVFMVWGWCIDLNNCDVLWSCWDLDGDESAVQRPEWLWCFMDLLRSRCWWVCQRWVCS